jgi:nucleotide-binding universal stress UspA family protein
MLSHVLVPLDGSTLAAEAVTHARNLLPSGGKITLVAAVEVPEMPIYGYYPAVSVPDYDRTIADLVPAAKHYLDGVAEELRHAGFQVRVEAQIGEPAETIIEVARKAQVEAIVISTHGRSGLSRWLFGSVTQKVLEAKVCPVYVIPSKEKAEPAKPPRKTEKLPEPV